MKILSLLFCLFSLLFSQIEKITENLTVASHYDYTVSNDKSKVIILNKFNANQSTFHIYDIYKGEKIKTIEKNLLLYQYNYTSFTPDGSKLIYKSDTRNGFTIFDIATNTEKTIYLSDGPVALLDTAVIYLKENNRVYSLNLVNSKEIKLFELDNSKKAEKIYYLSDYLIIQTKDNQDYDLRNIYVYNIKNQNLQLLDFLQPNDKKFIYKIHIIDQSKISIFAKNIYSNGKYSFAVLYDIQSNKIIKKYENKEHSLLDCIITDNHIINHINTYSNIKIGSIQYYKTYITCYDYNLTELKKFDNDIYFNYVYNNMFFETNQDFLYFYDDKSMTICRINLKTLSLQPYIDITINLKPGFINPFNIKFLKENKFNLWFTQILKNFNNQTNKFDNYSEEELFNISNVIRLNLSLINNNTLNQYRKAIQYLYNPNNLNPIITANNINPKIFLESDFHSGPISKVRISSNGKDIITASWDKSIKIWDYETGELKRTIYVPFDDYSQGMIYSLDISKDMKYIAAAGYSVGSGNQTNYSGDYVLLIDYNTGEILDIETAHSQAIFAVAFSDDSKLLASGGGNGDNSVAVFSIIDGKLKNRIRQDLQMGMIRDIKFVPGSHDMIVATEGGVLFQFRPAEFDETGNILPDKMSEMAMIGASPGKILNINKSREFNAIAIFNDAKTIVTISEKPQYFLVQQGKLSMFGNNLKPTKTINTKTTKNARCLALSNDNSFLAFAYDNIIKIFNLNDTSQSEIVIEDNKTILSLAFSNDNRYLITVGAGSYEITYWDFVNKTIFKKISPNYNNKFSEFGSSASNNRKIIWKFKKNDKLETFSFNLENFQYNKNEKDEILFDHKSFDAKSMYFPQDITTGMPLLYLQVNNYTIVGYRYSVLLLQNNKVISTISNRGIPAVGIAKLFNDMIIAVAYEDGLIEFCTISGIPLGTLIISDNFEYLFIHPSGYYTGNSSLLKNLGWKLNIWNYASLYLKWAEDAKRNPNGTYDDKFSFIKNEVYKNKFVKFFSFEQFDYILNRPEIVRSTFSPLDTIEYNYIKTAKQKILSKLNSTTNLKNNYKFSEVEILSKSRFTNNQDYLLEFRSSDTIKYYQIWINGVPQFTYPGKENILLNFDVKEKIKLSPGFNYIELATVSPSGIECFRNNFIVEYQTNFATTTTTNTKDKNKTKTKTSSMASPKVYLLAIGVSQFTNADYNLTYPTKDANDIVKVFTSIYDKSLTVKLLLDKNCNINSFNDAKKWLSAATENDIVIIFIASHGLIDLTNFNYYIATSNTNFQNPSEGSINFSEIENLLLQLKSRKKIVFIDACHSGEIDKDDFTSSQVKYLETSVKSRGLKVVSQQNRNNILSYEKIRFYLNELFVDLRKKSGAIVISSSSAQEFSYETDTYKNGLFTYTIINGLRNKNADTNKDGFISLDELKEYVIVTTQQLSSGYQTPTLRQDNKYLKLKF